MSEENLASLRNEKAKKIQHPKGKLTAYERIHLLLDEGSFSEIDENVVSEENPDGEAVVTGSGTIHGRPVFVFSEDFSVMGAALHKSLFPIETTKLALLNIGSEELKGNAIIKNTFQDLQKNINKLFEFQGYIEGNHIMDGDVNVIVTDGFTGNVALKTAEGTANFITTEIKKALTGNFLGKFSSFLNIKNINKFKNKLDPRSYNGAILLGLNSPVVKSHGGTDYVGFANALSVCEKIVKNKLIDKIKDNIN